MKILLFVAVTCLTLRASALPSNDHSGLRRRDDTPDESSDYSLTLDAPPPKRRHLGKGGKGKGSSKDVGSPYAPSAPTRGKGGKGKGGKRLSCSDGAPAMPIAPSSSRTYDTQSASAPTGADYTSSDDTSDAAAGGGVTPDTRVGGEGGGSGVPQEVTNDDMKKPVVPMQGN